MNSVWSNLLDNLALFLLQLGVLVVLAGIHVLIQRAQDWLNHHTTLTQRQIIMQVAQEAVVLAERAFADLNGQGKLNQAAAYMQSVLARRGIQLTDAEIRAAIEGALQVAKQQP
ncbi:MAG: phage holin [Thermoflavifilum sp.]|nr:phage holin [Thermoflavifilum sp.]MCL6514969.1 phage holin [Alicyclobacillus sp.]